MRMIIAIIQPYKIDDVIEALRDMGVYGITVQEVKGFGGQKGHTELYRGAEYVCELLPKVQVMTLIGDKNADNAKEAISKICRTGKIGDGIVWDIPFESYTKIRTGEEITT